SIGQLLQRNHARVAVAQPNVIAPYQEVIVEEAPYGRSVGSIGELFEDGRGEAVTLVPRALGKGVGLGDTARSGVEKVVDEPRDLARVAALEAQAHLRQPHLHAAGEPARLLHQGVVRRLPPVTGAAPARP